MGTKSGNVIELFKTKDNGDPLKKEYSKLTYLVLWSEEDKAYVGLCTDFASLSYVDTDSDKAWKGIHQLVKNVHFNK